MKFEKKLFFLEGVGGIEGEEGRGRAIFQNPLSNGGEQKKKKSQLTKLNELKSHFLLINKYRASYKCFIKMSNATKQKGIAGYLITKSY